MAARLGQLRLDAGQPVGGGPGGVHRDADRQGVDEEAEDGLGARQIGGAAGDGGAEHHVGHARLLPEDQRPGALDQGVEGQAVTAGEGTGAGGRRRVEGDLDAGGRRPRAGVPGRPVVRQRHRLLEAGQRPAPVGTSGLLVLAGQPAQVVTEGAADRRRGGGLPAEGGVLGDHVAQQRRVAPAVEEQVVEGPHDLHVPGAEPDQGHAQQRALGEVDAPGAVLGEEVGEQQRPFGLGRG
ncbi:hypothetical protein EES44_02855 [Streptomyces sp. ADI96-15]|nr:hypothetical protein EES44_02855 [Streptomyces sp. ADI96-15]